MILGTWQGVESLFRDRLATNITETAGSLVDALQCRVDLPHFSHRHCELIVTRLGVLALVGVVGLAVRGLLSFVTRWIFCRSRCNCVRRSFRDDFMISAPSSCR